MLFSITYYFISMKHSRLVQTVEMCYWQLELFVNGVENA